MIIKGDTTMKKKSLIICLVLMIIMLAGCSNAKVLEEAKTAVENYNVAAEEFNANVQSYNDTVNAFNDQVDEIQSLLDDAQAAINKGEEPYDSSTLDTLNNVITKLANNMPTKVEIIESAEILSVSEDAKSSELKALIKTANEGLESIDAVEIPAPLDLPDYTETIADITAAKTAYENSIQSLKQITAPTDEFVMERLQRIDTITAMAAVTEDTDANGMLNKQGGYIGCIYFADSQVDRSQLYIEGDGGPLDVCNDGGGTVEIFPTKEDAEKRNAYLGEFDSEGFLKVGSHYVVGTSVVRTSDYLTGTQQKELTEKITNALIAIDE